MAATPEHTVYILTLELSTSKHNPKAQPLSTTFKLVKPFCIISSFLCLKYSESVILQMLLCSLERDDILTPSVFVYACVQVCVCA